MSKAEPRFDLDLAYGQEAEKDAANFFSAFVNSKGRFKAEVKRKRIVDEYLYVETHCDYGRRGLYRPSGINVTTAPLWVFFIADTGIHVAIPTELLRGMLDDTSTKDKEERDGECPTRGKLIHFTTLLYREKQRRSQSSPEAKTVASIVECIHKPEFKENGRCRICEYSRQSESVLVRQT